MLVLCAAEASRPCLPSHVTHVGSSKIHRDTSPSISISLSLSFSSSLPRPRPRPPSLSPRSSARGPFHPFLYFLCHRPYMFVCVCVCRCVCAPCLCIVEISNPVPNFFSIPNPKTCHLLPTVTCHRVSSSSIHSLVFSCMVGPPNSPPPPPKAMLPVSS